MTLCTCMLNFQYFWGFKYGLGFYNSQHRLLPFLPLFYPFKYLLSIFSASDIMPPMGSHFISNLLFFSHIFSYSFSNFSLPSSLKFFVSTNTLPNHPKQSPYYTIANNHFSLFLQRQAYFKSYICFLDTA